MLGHEREREQERVRAHPCAQSKGQKNKSIDCGLEELVVWCEWTISGLAGRKGHEVSKVE